MARLSLCLLAIIATPGVMLNTDSVDFANKQTDIKLLYFHAREPNHFQKRMAISVTWTIEEKIEHFNNETAVKIWIDMKKNNWLLPVSVPFSVLNPTHRFEAVLLFHVLHSAKDYDTFYQSAVYVLDRVNQDLFIYVLNAVYIHRPDLKEFTIPPIYEVLPEYFNNAEILITAQRIGVHGERMIKFYPSTYKWGNSIVIKWNDTTWPYNGQSNRISYFLNDYGLNAQYYYNHVTLPNWLGGNIVPFVEDRRGECIWFIHKQILTRYYMERLSNGLGEINGLDDNVVHEGYNSGYMYHSGILYPVRPNHFHLDQPEHLSEIEKIKDYERRIRDAIESGYIINSDGKHVDIRSPWAFDILGRVIEAGVESPNVNYYRDFISSWKILLGNSLWREDNYHNKVMPLLVPSALEHYQTALSDPAFYMIWKRVLNLFSLWQHQLPKYEKEYLALTDVVIERVDVEKLTTFFEYTYMNISAFIDTDYIQSKLVYDRESVLVQYPRLNHKKFNVRVHVKSEVAKVVMVRFFLAPKYDSHGFEIPLHTNSENFFLLNHFIHKLPAGESVIVKESTQNLLTVDDLMIVVDSDFKVGGKKEFLKVQSEHKEYFPHRLLLPKGRVGGMPFIFMVYISEANLKIPSHGSYDIEHGNRYLLGDRLGFPFDRPLHQWQIQDIKNIYFQDVMIHHNPSPEIVVPHT